MPLKAALTAAAAGWPFVAGLGIVLWSKARATDRIHAGGVTARPPDNNPELGG